MTDKQGLDFLDVLVSQSPVVLFSADTNGILTLSRGKALEALGLAEGELVGQSIFDIYRDEPEVSNSARRALQGESVRSRLLLDGVTHETWFSPVSNSAGDIIGLVGVATDITEQVKIEEELSRRALFDPTTGLPNRNMLNDRLEAAIGKDPIQPFAIVAVGIDRFREVNSTFGFKYGDIVLQQVGEHLQQQFPHDSLVARTGGDEFAVMVSAVDAEELIAESVKKAVAAFEEPYYVEGNALGLEASIGLAIYPGHGDEPDLLLRRAGTAMQASKETGSIYTLYKPARDAARINNVALLAELRGAVESNQLFLHYQPKVNLSSGGLIGAEALVRWEHPTRGMVPPDVFIPLAERTGVIRHLTQQVANLAVQQIARWQKAGYNIPVAINLSSRSLQHVNLPEKLNSLLAVWGVAGEALELEITETAIMTDPEGAVDVCRRLRNMGMGIAIDDFGVGHSPLLYLKNMHATHIKIDKTFIKNIIDDPGSFAIVSSIIDLGKRLGILMVAEGIEDQATWDALNKLGCEQGQGYFIGRPMLADDLLKWIENPPFRS